MGNLLYRVDYPYTEGALGTATGSVEYGYNTTGWKDLLTSYNGRTITYDGIGNMTSDGLRTYTWKHGRELASLTQNGITWTNTYNADGLRVKREGDNGKWYTYTYIDGKLKVMSYNGNEVWMTYDAQGDPLSIWFEGYWYYYITNIQGDVIGLVNSEGWQGQGQGDGSLVPFFLTWDMGHGTRVGQGDGSLVPFFLTNTHGDAWGRMGTHGDAWGRRDGSVVS